ncbi:MAG: CBS domain-containing protein [Cyanobacteria bacterium J06629_19]
MVRQNASSDMTDHFADHSSAYASEAIAQSCMSSPAHTVPLSATVNAAGDQLRRYGHTALCVVDATGTLAGIISRRDVEVAIRHGLGHMPTATCMGAPVKSIDPQMPLATVQSLMATYDIGRLPVLSQGALVGIITRSDLLRHLSTADSQQLLSPISSISPRAQHGEQTSQPLPSVAELYEHLQTRIAPIWPALMLLADVAEEKGWRLYLVGGAVRDLLLNALGESYPLTDIDLVVDGAQSGTGGLLAEAIQARYPQVAARVYGEFQTATLTWPIDAATDFSIDIATARTEYYPYPAANPEVEVSTLHQDLYRRDFTINALALRLSRDLVGESAENSHTTGQLLDFFGGWIDLQQCCVRVIHPNSFIEDPTRIFRGVRFALRLGFSLSPRTEQLIRYAVDSDAYERMRNSPQKVPALQSRLTTELQYLLSLDDWAQALAEIERVGGLATVHPSLTISPVLWQQLQRIVQWQPRFASSSPRWLLLLSILIAALPSPECHRVAITLNLEADSQYRLKYLHQWEATLLTQLSQEPPPSRIFECLQPYGEFELLLIAARNPYTLAPHIWHYIVHLSRMLPLINGGTLKRLGYRPGPQFREMLTAVHRHTLDGDIDTAQAAEDYIIETYPLEFD